MGEKRKSLDEFTEKALHYPFDALQEIKRIWMEQVE
jgi:hypothetical protein